MVKEAGPGNILPQALLDRVAQMFTYGGRGFAHGMTQPLTAIENARHIAGGVRRGDADSIRNLGYIPGSVAGLSVAPVAATKLYKKLKKKKKKKKMGLKKTAARASHLPNPILSIRMKKKPKKFSKPSNVIADFIAGKYEKVPSLK